MPIVLEILCPIISLIGKAMAFNIIAGALGLGIAIQIPNQYGIGAGVAAYLMVFGALDTLFSVCPG